MASKKLKSPGDIGEVEQGSVKWFNTTKGYGFIAPDTGGKDVFVHNQMVRDSGLTGLRELDAVEFQRFVQDDGKIGACNIKVVIPGAHVKELAKMYSPEPDAIEGTVKWFNATKGYGFIEPEGGGKDVFVHISVVENSGLAGLAEAQRVRFVLTEGRDGRPIADNISLL